MSDNKVLIAKITSAHGIKGQVKIMSFSDNPGDIANYYPLYSKKGEEYKITLTSKASGKNKDIFIADIENVKDRNKAETLRNTELFVERKQLPEESEGEFYFVDLIGLDAVDGNNNKIGKVVDVTNYGAGDIIEIEFNDKKLEMFSFRDDIFPEINLDEKYIKFISPQHVEIKDEV